MKTTLKYAGMFFGLILSCRALAAGEAAFSVKPSVTKEGSGVRISFALAGPGDVEIAIMSGDKVVRHLAAGMVGVTNMVPAPFRAGLVQEIVWDGNDDSGQPVLPAAGRGNGEDLRVRVRLGMKAGLDRFIPGDPDPLGMPTALGVSSNGEVYVASNRYKAGGVSIYVLDRQGRYLRTIMPSPANLKAAQVKGLERLTLPGGREVPIIYGGYTSDTAPYLSGLRSQRLEITPQGWIIFASGANDMWDQSVPRHVLIIRPDGSTPAETGFVGPNLGPTRGYGNGMREQQLAASPDGRTLYFAGLGSGANGKNPAQGIHAIGRLAWDRGPAPFIGKPDESGSDGEHLNDPESVSTDAAGNILVADVGNNRVAVFAADGKFLGETGIARPRYICVHPGTGAMYVMTSPKVEKGNKPASFSVVKFDKAVNGRELARLDQTGTDPVLALDSGSKPPRLWLANGGLIPVDDVDGRLVAGANVIKPVQGGFTSPLYMVADPARARLYVGDFSYAVKVVDLKTDKVSWFQKASEAAVDRDGNVYMLAGYQCNSITRVTPEGKPLPFASGSNILKIKYRAGLPNVGVKGLTVAPGGDIFAYQDNNTYAPMHVWQFGPDGKLKKEGVIRDIPFDSGTGLAVDRAGNIYAGLNIHDHRHLYPGDFGEQIPPLAWYTSYDSKGGWYAKPQHGMPGAPWNRSYINFYLYQYGSVVKFGPEGGVFYSGGVPAKDGNNVRPAGVPADAVEYRNGYLGRVVWLKGARWVYQGFGIAANRTESWGDPACSCMSSRFGIDEYDRLFVPDVFRFSVGVVDPACNEIMRIGAYGNVDSAGPKSLIPEPSIPFTAPNAVAAGDGKVYVADRKSRRIAVINLSYAAEEICDIK